MAVAQCWRRAVSQVLTEDGLSDATALPLVVLLRYGDGVRQGELAERVGVEGTSVVRILDSLENSKLVRRESDAQDRRAKRIYLTEEGRAQALHCDETLSALRMDLLERVSEEDLQATDRVLTALSEALQVRLQKKRG